MSRDEFERIRAQVCDSGPASDGDNLYGMEIDAFLHLGGDGRAGVWSGMTVCRCDGAEWLIVGRGTGRAADASAISEELSRVWEEDLRYQFQSAHTVISTTECVELRAVTQIRDAGIWVTANVQVVLD